MNVLSTTYLKKLKISIILIISYSKCNNNKTSYLMWDRNLDVLTIIFHHMSINKLVLLFDICKNFQNVIIDILNEKRTLPYVLNFRVATKNKIVKMLIEKGCDINAKNDFGYTALEIAIEKRNIECVKMLIDKHNTDTNDFLIYAGLKCIKQTEHVKSIIDKSDVGDVGTENILLDHIIKHDCTLCDEYLNELVHNNVFSALLYAIKYKNVKCIKLVFIKSIKFWIIFVIGFIILYCSKITHNKKN